MQVFAISLAILLVVVFVTGFLWPRGSRKLQEKVKAAVSWFTRKLNRADQVGDDDGLGGKVVEAAEKSSLAAEESAHAGRRAHDEVFDSPQGTRQEEILERRYGKGAERGREDRNGGGDRSS